jgi:hypothetical protein
MSWFLTGVDVCSQDTKRVKALLLRTLLIVTASVPIQNLLNPDRIQVRLLRK